MRPTMPEMALRLQQVSHLFFPGTPDEVRAIDSVDLELVHGSFTVVLGANGSGKSSLLSAIAGSLSRTRGRIFLGEQEVTQWPEHRRAHLIGRVFQNPLMGTAADLTVAENLTLAGRRGSRRLLRPALGAERKRLIQGQVAKLGMGLEQRLDTPMGMLSGGQRQALTVLMATIVKPTLLLLDEHTAALDPRTAETVMQATIAAVQRAGLTTLMVTHNMAHALAYGNRLIMMMEGRIIYEASGAEKTGLTIESLVRRFHVTSDRMLLS